MNAAFSLSGRVAVVTGAGGLLGKEHCAALSAVGAAIVALDSDESRSAGAIAGLPTETMAVVADVTDPISLRDALTQAIARFDRIDVLVNNAAIDDKVEGRSGATPAGAFETYPLESWRRMIDVNVTGVFLVSQIFGAPMARRGVGSIVNIASTYGLVAPDQSLYRRPDGSQALYKSPAYPTSKGAVISFTRYLAAYWGSAGVRVNSLSPGGVENGQERSFVERYSMRTPLGRMARPADYRGALCFLASDASAYMTGANLVVDGGWTAW